MPNVQQADLRRDEGMARGRRILVAAVAAPALITLAVIFSQFNRFPYQDDYGAILAFAIHLLQLHGVGAKCLYIVAAQHSEYKLIFEHAIVAVELALTHHLSFSFLTGVGNLLILPIGYVLWLGYPAEGKSAQEKLREFVPVSLVFFAIGYWENLNWAMTGLVNIPLVLFSLLALYCLTAESGRRIFTRWMLFGCVAAAVAACTSANGFLLAPVGSVFLLSQRAGRRLLAWNVAFVLPVAMYLYGYHAVVHDVRGSLWTVPVFFLEFVGWAVPLRWGSVALALMLLAIAVLAVRERFDRVSPFTVYSALWVLTTAGLVAAIRGGTGHGMSARYSIYSQLLVVFSYVFLRVRWREAGNKRLERALIIGCVLYFLLVDARAWKSLHLRNRMIVAGMHFYEENPAANSPMIDPEVMREFPEEQARELVEMNQAVAAGIYQPPRK